jgi:ferredoxin
MKCIIVYFSQTGNTELVASRIARGVKKAAGQCDLVPLKEANPRRLYNYDLIGLGCPVFELVEPGNVRAFIHDMRFVGGKHIFAFSTHGTLPDHLFPSIVPRLKKRGLLVIGTRDWYADCHLPPMPEPYPTAGHPDKIDLREAEEFGFQMVERSRRIAAGETALIPPDPLPPPPPVNLGDLGFVDFQETYKALFKFHPEKCQYPACRLCMDNCPMDGIDLSVNPPVVGKPCVMCTFCSRICPTGAMDIDDWVENTGAVNEKVMRAELLPALEKAEAEGRFRRLIPVEKIGFSTPIYKFHNKHPQWIIGQGLQ